MPMPMAQPAERVKDFRTIELGFTHQESFAEATRCLRCQSEVCVGCTFCARTCPDYCIHVERVDDPGARCLTRYELDLTKCCFCGLCAEQCPTSALTHTGQYELSFYHRDLAIFDKGEMLRDPNPSRATGRDGIEPPCVPRAASGRTSCERAGHVVGPRRCVTVAGAILVLLAREMTRLLLALGAFLLGVAGLYAYYGFGAARGRAAVRLRRAACSCCSCSRSWRWGATRKGGRSRRRFDVGAFVRQRGPGRPCSWPCLSCLAAAAPGPRRPPSRPPPTALLGPLAAGVRGRRACCCSRRSSRPSRSSRGVTSDAGARAGLRAGRPRALRRAHPAGPDRGPRVDRGDARRGDAAARGVRRRLGRARRGPGVSRCWS